MKKKHWKLVILSGILYFVCQICRTDLSACMVDLLPDLGIAKDAMGLAITAGYIAYAVGMSINSLLTDYGVDKAPCIFHYAYLLGGT